MGSVAWIVSAVTQGAETGLSYEAHQQNAQAARMRGNFENDVAQRNAQLAEKQAEDARNIGNLQENRDRLQTEQELGATRAAQGASGADVSSGSAADVRASESLVGDIDALQIRNNAAREAWGYDVGAANERMQGRLAQLAGTNEAAAQQTAAYTTLLTGAASTYSLSKLRPSRTSLGTPSAPSPTKITTPVVTRSGNPPYPG